MSPSPKQVRCEEVAPLLVFYTCEEVTAEERQEIATHLANCNDCRAQLAEEQQLQESVSNATQAADQLDRSGVLLSQCRSELAETLDELSAPKLDESWRPFGWAREWMALRPAWSAVALLLVGAVVGTQALQWMPFGVTDAPGSPVNVLASSKLTPDQFSKMKVSGINVSRPTGRVQVQLQAEQPISLSSDEDDADVRRVLTYVISNSERFDAGVRLDCLEALRSAAMDQQVRAALLSAARKDQNPAVRMKALDALRDEAADPGVRNALLDALKQDPNPGVRVEAVNLLVRSLEVGNEAPEMAGTGDGKGSSAGIGVAPEAEGALTAVPMERILRALEEVRRNDSNRYVRLRSAAALRQINPQDVQ
jgi:hypothetical protein